MEENKIKELICGKCKKPFRSLRAGLDSDYINLLNGFTDFCFKEGVTDQDCVFAVRSWLKNVERRVNKKERIFQLIRELLED